MLIRADIESLRTDNISLTSDSRTKGVISELLSFFSNLLAIFNKSLVSLSIEPIVDVEDVEEGEEGEGGEEVSVELGANTKLLSQADYSTPISLKNRK